MSTTMVGEAAPPVVLLAFGASLYGQRFRLHSRAGALISLASVVKLVVQPGIACLVGSLMGLEGAGLMAVTVMAALPTAQIVFVHAMRYRTSTSLVQATTLWSTLLCVPVILAASTLLH